MVFQPTTQPKAMLVSQPFAFITNILVYNFVIMFFLYLFFLFCSLSAESGGQTDSPITNVMWFIHTVSNSLIFIVLINSSIY